jgi:hypothetical protein
MKNYNISTPETFQSEGQEKTAWHQVGKLRITDEGKMFIKLNLVPSQTFVCFEQEDKKDNSR